MFWRFRSLSNFIIYEKWIYGNNDKGERRKFKGYGGKVWIRVFFVCCVCIKRIFG